jgi:hypothetical protein
MSKDILASLIVVASVTIFTGPVVLAQQAGGGPLPQLGQKTPGGRPPAEIAPSHPLNSTAGPRTGTTTGVAPAQGGGKSQGNNATDNEKK